MATAVAEGEAPHFAVPPLPDGSPRSSPTLQEKKKLRDAKRKILENLFDQHKRHEQRELPPSATNFLSYQKGTLGYSLDDLERGRSANSRRQDEEKKDDDESEQDALSHNRPNQYGDILLTNTYKEYHGPPCSMNPIQALMERFEANPRQIGFGGILLFLLFYWWL